MSDFAALNTALSGLVAHRRASEQIGHNIANVNTEGYSRTRLELTSAGGGPIPAVFATPRTQGDGVNVSGLLRIRDEFLEKRSLAEQGNSSQLTASKEILSRVESTFPEPGDNGLAAQLSQFWASWDDVANNPSSLGTRTQLLEQATTVAQTLNRSASDLTSLRNSGVDQLGVQIKEVNADTARIAELNGAIQSAVSSNLPANDLQDQRDLLVEKVAKLTGATTRDIGNGMIELRVGGATLVSANRSTDLTGPVQTAPPSGNAPTDAVNWASVSIQSNGYTVSFPGGQMAGLLEGVNTTLPQYLARINTVATTLANSVNAVHSTGFGLNDGGPTAPGRTFFDFNSGVGAAAGITLSSGPNGVAGKPANVAVSSAAGQLDASLAQQLAALHDSTTGADASYRSLIADLGVASQTAQRRSDIQDAITTQVEAQRKSVSGVNLDEEMVNLTMTQHAYSASAKLMTTIDQMIQTLINLGN